MARGNGGESPVGLEYPCRIDIKVFIRCEERGIEVVTALVLDQVEKADLIGISRRASRGGNIPITNSFSRRIAPPRQLFQTLLSALASCFALPPPSLESSALAFLLRPTSSIPGVVGFGSRRRSTSPV